MPKRDADLLVEDILEALRKINLYTAGMGQEEFRQDPKTIDAVIRNLEILGEAARQLPAEFIVRHPGIPWRQIAGLRNRVVHEYFAVDLEIVWQVIRDDLSQLEAQLKSLE
ncbi:MAG TPA: DUF86 domain-containing protein [Thermoanaerobaculia bacterium]